MKKALSCFVAALLITSCVSKSPQSSDSTSEYRKPSGFFDFLFKKNEAITLMTCANCNSPHSEPGTIQIESENSCSVDRLYYQDRFKKISENFKLKRESFPEAEFSEACTVHIMRGLGGYDAPSTYLTKCENEESAPLRETIQTAECEQNPNSSGCSRIQGQKLACVTPEYAYSTYNAYVDVMDCLEIPQRELLPKLWNESQFHVNIYGKGDDTGVGQLTGDAIQEVVKQKYADRDIKEIEYYKQEMIKAQKPSCDRILAEESAWKIVDPKLSNRCGLLMPETSPLRNILYTGIFYRVVTSRIAGIYYRAGKEYIRNGRDFTERTDENYQLLSGAIEKLDLAAKMRALGIENPNMNYLKQVLVSLAFNTGSSEATRLFDNFLKARIANGQSLNEADLDFINTDSSEEIALLTAPADETEESRNLRLAKLEEARAVAHERKLPQYLRLMQPSGSPGYVSKIAFRTKKLNTEIGVGVCTQPSFLQHSLVPAPAQ